MAIGYSLNIIYNWVGLFDVSVIVVKYSSNPHKTFIISKESNTAP